MDVCRVGRPHASTRAMITFSKYSRFCLLMAVVLDQFVKRVVHNAGTNDSMRLTFGLCPMIRQHHPI